MTYVFLPQPGLARSHNHCPPQLPLFNVSLALSFLSLTPLESALHRRCSIIPQQPKSHQRLQLDIGLPSTTYSSCTKD